MATQIIKKISVIAVVGLLVSPMAYATVYFSVDNEAYPVNSDVPVWENQGPYRTEYNAPTRPVHDETAKIRNATPYPNGGKYVELTTYSSGFYDVVKGSDGKCHIAGGRDGADHLSDLSTKPTSGERWFYKWGYPSNDIMSCPDWVNGKQYRATQSAYAIEMDNHTGAYGQVPWDEDRPVSIVAGTTYYLGGYFRFDRINNMDIWNDLGDNFSADKLFEFQGDHFRWGMMSGWDDQYTQFCNRAGAPCRHKWQVDIFVATASSVTCWTAYDHLPHNVGPYNSNNPLLLDYSRWYSIVLGITAQSNNTGRAQLWVNGVKLVDRTGCTMDPGGATVKRLYYSGTIAQAGYDSPQHKRLFDRLIFTDAWTDITNGGYLKDPNDGSIVTPMAPAAPRNLNVR